MKKTEPEHTSFLAAGGEMGQLTRQKDWSQTVMGPVETWPQSLRTTLGILLNSRFPMFLYWGPELICFYNDAYRPSLGQNGKHPSILGMRAEEAWPEIWPIIKPLIDQVLVDGEATWSEDQLIPIYRNGHIEDVYWTFSYSPVYDESSRIAGVFVTCSETTRHIEFLRKIEESELRFRTVADSAPAQIWMADPDQRCTFFNKAWLSYTGRALEDECGFGWLQGVHPDDRDRLWGVYTSSFAKREAFSIEYRLRRHDGEYRWVADRGTPRLPPSGDFEGFIGACVDIHEQKLFAEELEKLVRDRTYELERKNAELQLMNKELQSFAYISSHDLQEPLRKIQTFSTRILEKEHHLLSADGRDKFHRMQQAAQRMQKLIEDLLAYSRTTMAERKFKKVHLKEVIEEVTRDLKEEIQEKNATIEVNELCEVPIIPFQFRQLVYNLLSNSLKFSNGQSTPHIRINGQIVHTSEVPVPPPPYCRLQISDNGIGFEPQYSERIFEVFQRLHGKELYKGTGIGLAIVKKIIENHNGTIRALSEPGQGATFDIYLPVTQAEVS